jgi:hypothetical protein
MKDFNELGMYFLKFKVDKNYKFLRKIGDSSFTTLAGNPTTNELGGTSLVTTAPAPTITFSPKVIFGRRTAFVPILQKSPIVQLPET